VDINNNVLFFDCLQIEEVQIAMPWGYVAGKWWGPKDVRPIVSLHGWQDNAGTFDALIPLLPKEVSFLAVDLPGHGLSSRLPNGVAYDHMGTIYMLQCLQNEYKWETMSLMGHSLGSIISFLYSAIFPDKVDMVIGLDALKPQVRNVPKAIESLKGEMEAFYLSDKRNLENSEPPSYPYDVLVERLVSSTFGSITKEAAPFLLKRAIKESTKNPEMFYFTRDSRLKSNFNLGTPQETTNELIKKIKCPYLYVKATDSPFYEKKEFFEQSIQAFKEHNPNFELHFIDAKHHLHLTDATKINGILSDFIIRNRGLDSKL